MNHSINFSNYLKLEVLFSYEDLKKLFELLKPFEFFNVSGVQESTSLQETSESFLNFYKNYLTNLFGHGSIDPQIISKMFSLSVAPSEDFFHKITFSQDRFLWKPKRSVIQFQPLGLFISSINHFNYLCCCYLFTYVKFSDNQFMCFNHYFNYVMVQK